MNDHVLNRLRPYLPARCRGAGLHTLVASLQLESIDLVELLCGMDTEFGVSLTIEEFQSAHTVGELLAIITRKHYALR
ncbi:MAG TPA: phosphopantetheine-binding protein [Verrucomicrobiae bacterium]|nr:phosphopantetheine-binding protein [Verrucomicrobiae bacterium]